MDYRGILVVFAVAFVSGPAAASAGQVQRSSLNIVISNQAEIPADEIRAASRVVDDVFARAGVRISWDAASHDARSFAVHLLLRKRNPSWSPKAPSVMGVALASDDQRGVTMVYYEAIAAAARKYNHSARELLAIAFAHEIGHLLLPYPAHSTDGVMRADWEGHDIRHAMHGELHFTPAQAELIRRKLDGASQRPRE
jgi:hypothetical protein